VGKLKGGSIGIARQRPRLLAGETLGVGEARGIGCRVRGAGRFGGVDRRDAEAGDEKREAQEGGAEKHGGIKEDG
jgi:hypothetical protein